MTTSSSSSEEEGYVGLVQQRHQHHDDEVHPHQLPVSSAPLRRNSRTKLLLSALALCAVGLLCQMQSLQTNFSPLRKTKNTDDHHLTGSLFIPSMEYRVDGKSVYSKSPITKTKGTNSVDNMVDCSRPVKDVEWEWFNEEAPSRRQNRPKNQHKPRLLIALSSGYDKFGELLSYSAPSAKVYATQHDAAVVVLQGMAFAPQGCTPPASHASLNKIRLLFHAIDHSNQFDQVLLLDADAVMVNMEFDVTELLVGQQLLAAQPVRQGDNLTPPLPHKINAGATLWNLHHPDIKTVALDWFQGAKMAVLNSVYHGDQKHLQAALEQQYYPQSTNTVKKNNKNVLRLLQDEFAYAEGTVVQHFLQHSTMSWKDRKAKVQRAFDKVCKAHSKECAAVPQTNYATQ